jgi:hypothetical protein
MTLEEKQIAAAIETGALTDLADSVTSRATLSYFATIQGLWMAGQSPMGIYVPNRGKPGQGLHVHFYGPAVYVGHGRGVLRQESQPLLHGHGGESGHGGLAGGLRSRRMSPSRFLQRSQAPVA